MDQQNLLTRIVAAGLPLVVIAIVFGAVGYATTRPQPAPIPPLTAAPPTMPAAQGELFDLQGNQIRIVTETGAQRQFTLSPDAPVEILIPIGLADLKLGDWLNGGAVGHPDTLLALLNLILLSDPVTP